MRSHNVVIGVVSPALQVLVMRVNCDQEFYMSITEKHAFQGMDSALKQLVGLHDLMSAHIEKLMALLPLAITLPDEANFQQAKAIDKVINDAEVKTEKTVIDIFNKYPATGEDLRFIIASIKISGLQERMADKLKNAIKHLSRLSTALPHSAQESLRSGADALRALLPLALVQLHDYSSDRAQTMLRHGAEVQKAYRHIVLQLHQASGVLLNQDATHVLLVAKNLEQVADKSIEMMKIAHFVATGTKYEKRSENDV
jgi:phosphate transport system protein